MIKLILTLAFFIMIWDADVIGVRWEDQPAGETSVLCTVTDNFGTAETLELEQFTWTNNNRDGEWRIYHNFNGRSWFANCPNLDELIHPQTESQTNRARLLLEKYKMDPEFMKEVDERDGPLEWRLPESHAIYWAAYGLKVAAKNPGKVKPDLDHPASRDLPVHAHELPTRAPGAQSARQVARLRPQP